MRELTMKRLSYISLAVLTGGLAVLAGCATAPVVDLAQESTKYTIESTEKFVARDRIVQATVTCTGLRERIRPDGRFEVVANLKNRDEQPQRIQISCVFKDPQGIPTGDTVPTQTVKLDGNATETVRFTSTTPQARLYTISVRQAR